MDDKFLMVKRSNSPELAPSPEPLPPKRTKTDSSPEEMVVVERLYETSSPPAVFGLLNQLITNAYGILKENRDHPLLECAETILKMEFLKELPDDKFSMRCHIQTFFPEKSLAIQPLQEDIVARANGLKEKINAIESHDLLLANLEHWLLHSPKHFHPDVLAKMNLPGILEEKFSTPESLLILETHFLQADQRPILCLFSDKTLESFARYQIQKTKNLSELKQVVKNHSYTFCRLGKGEWVTAYVNSLEKYENKIAAHEFFDPTSKEVYREITHTAGVRRQFVEICKKSLAPASASDAAKPS